MRQFSWGLVVTIVFALFLATLIARGWFPNIPPMPELQVEAARSGNYLSLRHQCQPSQLAAIPDAEERLKIQSACAKEAEEYRISTNNVIQQTRAANAAEVQAKVAGQALELSWLQTIGGFLTLIAAALAAYYAREAAIAARENITATWELGMPQVEANVVLEVPHLAMSRSLGDEADVILNVDWKNSGQTAATETALELKLDIVDAGASLYSGESKKASTHLPLNFAPHQGGHSQFRLGASNEVVVKISNLMTERYPHTTPPVATVTFSLRYRTVFDYYISKMYVFSAPVTCPNYGLDGAVLFPAVQMHFPSFVDMKLSRTHRGKHEGGAVTSVGGRTCGPCS